MTVSSTSSNIIAGTFPFRQAYHSLPGLYSLCRCALAGLTKISTQPRIYGDNTLWPPRFAISSLRSNPFLYDSAKRLYRQFSASKPLSYLFFDELSRKWNGQVRFVQIGANDGLRNDPIREFIVRDQWTGILVEPLPNVFETLYKNYSYLRRSNLTFVNAAITAVEGQDLSFWTFHEQFLRSLPPEERLTFLRKSSFERSNVERLLETYPDKLDFDHALEEIAVPCLTLHGLIKKYGSDPQIDLLVIDAEGHEALIIPSIKFDLIRPYAIFFESSHLDTSKDRVFSFLVEHGYEITELSGSEDSVAVDITRNDRS